MSKVQVLGIVRHLLTFIGGGVVAKGVISESELFEISGGLITLIGSIWSVIEKTKREL